MQKQQQPSDVESQLQEERHNCPCKQFLLAMMAFRVDV
jgi:hypothetical protein